MSPAKSQLAPALALAPTFALALLLPLAAIGCDGPIYESGHLQCAPDNDCPAGFHCAADDRCWLNGQEPDLSPPLLDLLGIFSGDLAAPPDLTSIDLATVDGCGPPPACNCGALTLPCGETIVCGDDCTSRAQICGGANFPNFCGCPASGRSGVYSKISADGYQRCLTLSLDDCPTFLLEGSGPKFYTYGGDPTPGTVPLIRCLENNFYVMGEDATCDGFGAAALDGTAGYVPTQPVCGTVPLHRYNVGGLSGWFYTTDLSQAPAGVAETLPPFYVWLTP